MAIEIDLHKAILNAWKTSNRATVFLIEHISTDLWNEKVPGSPRRTVGTIASHLHNSRCRWITRIAKAKTIKVPALVDPYRANRVEVTRALNRSGQAMLKLLSASIDNKGKLPSTPAWLNFPNDTIHLLAYFVAHEAHHRGQIIILARQLNHRLPKDVVDGVWQWTRRLREAR
jgi:uncharacterized damage-inducible protein DinB